MIKARTVALAACIAFSTLAFTAGCHHRRDDGRGGGSGTGGTIDSSGTMDQGRRTTEPGTGGGTGAGGAGVGY